MRVLRLLLVTMIAALGFSQAARADDIDATERSVVRVVTVAVVNGEVAGFGHGSGFAVGPNRIVTNAHVVGDAEQYPQNVAIGVVPSEGTQSFPARLIAIDRRRDLALIEIVRGRVAPASLYTGPIAQRATVFALGYPGNVDMATAQSANEFIRPQAPVASDGIVSSRDSINGVNTLVHDADIARGNSGGPLVDRCGRVIGVNTFITRADEGDSPFSFAVSMNELAAFLREARQGFAGTATGCVTQEEAAARVAERRMAGERARAEASAAAAATQAEALQARRAEVQSQRESYIAVALGLFAMALLSAMAAMMFSVKNRSKAVRAAALAAGVALAGAIVTFLMRPDPQSVTAESLAAAGTAALTQAGGTSGGAVNQIQPAILGQLTCTVQADESRLTVSAGNDATLAVDGDGCVNTRTQYAADQDGKFTRTLVPQQDATVSRMSYDPASGRYVVERWLMSLADMQRIRAIPGPATRNGCTTEAAQRTAISEREAALARLLTAQPHERIVHRCTAAGR